MNTLKKICIVISISAFVNALIAIVDFVRVIEYQTGEGYIKFIVNIVFYLGIGIGGIAGNGAIQTSVPSNENNINKSNDKVGFEKLNQYFPTNNEKKIENQGDGNVWICDLCGAENDKSMEICEVCGKIKNK